MFELKYAILMLSLLELFVTRGIYFLDLMNGMHRVESDNSVDADEPIMKHMMEGGVTILKQKERKKQVTIFTRYRTMLRIIHNIRFYHLTEPFLKSFFLCTYVYNSYEYVQFNSNKTMITVIFKIFMHRTANL